MNGQWVGAFNGSNSGVVIMNIDERREHYQGIAYFLDHDSGMPSVAAAFQTSGKEPSPEIVLSRILPVNPVTDLPDAWSKVAELFPRARQFPRHANMTLNLSDDKLAIQWETDLGTNGSGELSASSAGNASGLTSEIVTWEQYKSAVSQLPRRNCIFRGQPNTWRLRSSFHRSGRADLARYMTEDISLLHKQLSARTRHVFDLSKPDESGAFLNLVHHHGYPAPCIDFTYSPYVAAFFAFREISARQASASEENAHARIHVFDAAAWRADYPQSEHLATAHPHVSIAENIAVENERRIPQQALSLVTNIDDIESYIAIREQERDKSYLRALDIPVSERDRVAQDLRLMGITAGALFPGPEGTCEELRDRNFDL